MSGVSGRIRHQDELEKYVPPGHHGTVNVRLIEKNFCGSLEMAHGTLDPNGVAHAHDHETEYQVIYILEGKCDVALGDDPIVECRAGSIIEIPPKVMHEVTAKGDTPLRVLVIYSPPLPSRDDIPVN